MGNDVIMLWVLSALAILMAALAVRMNISYSKRRARLTAEQRREEDEIDKIEGQSW